MSALLLSLLLTAARPMVLQRRQQTDNRRGRALSSDLGDGAQFCHWRIGEAVEAPVDPLKHAPLTEARQIGSRDSDGGEIAAAHGALLSPLQQQFDLCGLIRHVTFRRSLSALTDTLYYAAQEVQTNKRQGKHPDGPAVYP